VLSSQALGDVYDTVRFRLDGNVHETGYQGKDGDSAYLDAGTKVYRVQGYNSTFRLAAYSSGQQGAQELHYYDAQVNPRARTGADLLDIGGKVTSIGVASPQDKRTEVGTITDQQQVTALVQMVLDAPVDQSGVTAAQESTFYFVVFHLSDATVATRSFTPSIGFLDWDIHVPRAFGDAIMRAATGSS